MSKSGVASRQVHSPVNSLLPTLEKATPEGQHDSSRHAREAKTFVSRIPVQQQAKHEAGLRNKQEDLSG